ncbi:MAG: response regulator [Actinobacteria bacterium]|nr:response regulator [Actinomycetota bacterium]MCG2818496.1 response regulator [Actinomycetes bacterium]MBU4178701.1 response regulator [Actinomycetota bacterium]MBU4219408.1 response regulator [Actinomycetota bacterium]MBU4358152.1 response regulator [Actinomycetota bacterium]
MSSRKILVVDDDPTMVKLINVNLKLNNYSVVEATSGEQALNVLAAETVDLIVLDIMMPGVDGWEVLKRIRSSRETEEMPVILVTAKTQDSDVIRGWELGADEYVIKPFNPLLLVEVIRMVLDRSYEERLERRKKQKEKLEVLRSLSQPKKDSGS